MLVSIPHLLHISNYLVYFDAISYIYFIARNLENVFLRILSKLYISPERIKVHHNEPFICILTTFTDL
jgi:hypothetical protein